MVPLTITVWEFVCLCCVAILPGEGWGKGWYMLQVDDCKVAGHVFEDVLIVLLS